MRVKLLSSAQRPQASRTATAGHKDPSGAWSCGQLSSKAPATTATMPSAIRRPRFSLNTAQASSVVRTASALSNKAAWLAGMPDKPNINSTGASTPPHKTAAIIQPVSLRFKRGVAEPRTSR